MLSGFFVQEATKIPFVEKLIAGSAINARIGFESLLSKSATIPRDLGFGGRLNDLPALSNGDKGFPALSVLYSSFIVRQSKEKAPTGKISSFVDACAVIPDKHGLANLIVVEWANGSKRNTSYEEISELIAKQYGDSIRPFQYSLFAIGFLVAIATIKITYFPKQPPEIMDANKQKNGDRSKKTNDRKPIQ